MLISLYVLYSVIAFTFFGLSVFMNKGIYNVFIWPIPIWLFSVLTFGAISIKESLVSANIIDYPSLVLFNGAMALLSLSIFGWDIYDKFKSGELW